MAKKQLRFIAVCLGLAAQIICCQAENFYVAQKNAVYITEARQLQIDDPSLIPLALIQKNWGWMLSVLHPDRQSVGAIEFWDVRKMVHDPSLQPESIIVSEGKLFQKLGPLRFFKKYPTDAYDGALNVTPVPRANRIFVTLAPYQKNQFIGSTCIVTDVITKEDVHIAPQSKVDTAMQPILTWVSDRTILAFIYAYHGNSGYNIDTRSFGWNEVSDAQYFLFDGVKLTLYIPSGDHFEAKVPTNFAKSRNLFPSLLNYERMSGDLWVQSTFASSLN